MGPDEVLEKLAAILPGFGSRWDEPSNDHRGDDGSFTPCGAFAEATAFVRERYEMLTGPQLDELSQFVEACMTPPGTPLGDAAATCFLENLTIEPFSADLQTHLRGEALKIFRGWGGT